MFLTAAMSAILIVIVFIFITRRKTHTALMSPRRRAGRMGELAAASIIEGALREGDRFFTNVSFSFEGRPAELDNVIVNRYGVFIIEVKYYEGRLVGGADDFEWQKHHTTRGGNTYVKAVKNPLKQVSRQVYLLARFLEKHGVRVWVEGYAMLLCGNSPVNSPHMLHGAGDVDRAVHSAAKRGLDKRSVEAAARLLSQMGTERRKAKKSA